MSWADHDVDISAWLTVSSSSALIGQTITIATSRGNVMLPSVYGCVERYWIKCIPRMNMCCWLACVDWGTVEVALGMSGTKSSSFEVR